MQRSYYMCRTRIIMQHIPGQTRFGIFGEGFHRSLHVGSLRVEIIIGAR